MNQWQKEYRQRRGKELAAHCKIEQVEGEWIVPSSKGGRKKYRVTVEPTNISCTCVDHQETRDGCKHIFTVEELLQQQSEFSKTTGTLDLSANGGASGPLRPTFRRDWSLYNTTLANEQDEFQPLAADLCSTIAQPAHQIGRRPVPYRDAVMASIIKVYLNLSERRVMPHLHHAYDLGYLGTQITFGTVAAYLEKPELTPILRDLIVRSSRPLVPV